MVFFGRGAGGGGLIVCVGGGWRQLVVLLTIPLTKYDVVTGLGLSE